MNQGWSKKGAWIGEGGLDQTFEESELQDALATYQEVRKALQAPKTHQHCAWTRRKGGRETKPVLNVIVGRSCWNPF